MLKSFIFRLKLHSSEETVDDVTITARNIQDECHLLTCGCRRGTRERSSSWRNNSRTETLAWTRQSPATSSLRSVSGQLSLDRSTFHGQGNSPWIGQLSLDMSTLPQQVNPPWTGQLSLDRSTLPGQVNSPWTGQLNSLIL